MSRIRIAMLIGSVVLLLVGSCAERSENLVELRHFPLDELTGIIADRYIQVDRAISADGNGSLQVTIDQPTVVQLYELDNLDIEDASLIYRARLRTQNVKGRVYLEMLCHFPELGEYFSRDVQTPLSGTTDWTTEETPFFLRRGQNPDRVKLNLVFEGSGTAWIDDIRLLKGPLPQ
ncbi:hypothetical protein ACFLQW_00555 [Candidatus Zixiibacteriota bacterium]